MPPDCAMLDQPPSTAAIATSEDDVVLLRRFVDAGDRAAMNALLLRHLDCAYRVALRCTRNAADAEDAVQAACVDLLRRAGEFRGTATVRAFFMGFIVAACRHKSREEGRRAAREAAVQPPAAPSDALAVAESDEQRALVLGALRDLPEHYRQPLWLHFVEGWTADEVASALKLSDKTIRTQIRRGLDKLRGALTVSGITAASLPVLLATLPLETASAALAAGVGKSFALAAAAAPAKVIAGHAVHSAAVAGKSAVLLGGAGKLVAVVALVAAVGTGAVIAAKPGHPPAALVVAPPTPAANEKPKGNDRAPLGSPDFYPSAEHPIGWRGDSTGRYPAANPPLEWYRRPRGAWNSLRVSGNKPKGAAPEGQAPNMGAIREWMVVGPFDAKDYATALDDVTQPNETALQPAAGEMLGGKPWKPLSVSVGNQSQSWARLTVDFVQLYGTVPQQEAQNHPGSLPAQVNYAFTYIYAAEACKAMLHVSGTKVRAWLNGTLVKIPGQYEAPPAVDLVAGWNKLLVKAAQSKANCNFSALLSPAPGGGYETKNIVWMTPMPGASWSSPIVVGPKLFINADDGTLLCLSKDDGRVLWARDLTFYNAVNDEERAKFPDLAAKHQQLDQLLLTLPGDLNAGISVDGSKADGNTVMHAKIKQKQDLERAIQGTMGKNKTYEVWANNRGTTTPTPVCDGKNVYVAFYGGDKGIGCNAVACFDLEGKMLWSYFTGKTGIGEHGTHSTPTLSGNVLVYLSGATLFGFDKTTGKLLWQKKPRSDAMSGASLVALKAGSVDAVLAPNFGIYRSADGAELWKTDVGSDIATPSLVDGILYGIGGGQNPSYYAFGVEPSGDGLKPHFLNKTPWKSIALTLPGSFTDSVIGSPLYDNGLYYVASEGGGLTVVDAQSGKQVYTKALETLNPRLTWVFVVGICSGPTLAGKYIHIRDDQGQTLVIAPGPQYKELAKNVLWELQPNGVQQESQSNPAYEGGRMYYRTQNFLYCIGEK